MNAWGLGQPFPDHWLVCHLPQESPAECAQCLPDIELGLLHVVGLPCSSFPLRARARERTKKAYQYLAIERAQVVQYLGRLPVAF